LKNSRFYAGRFKFFLGDLRQQFEVPEPERIDPVTQLVIGFLMWEASSLLADEALRTLHREFVDFNELRIALPVEVAELLGPHYPRALERADRLHAALNDLYAREQTLRADWWPAPPQCDHPGPNEGERAEDPAAAREDPPKADEKNENTDTIQNCEDGDRRDRDETRDGAERNRDKDNDRGEKTIGVDAESYFTSLDGMTPYVAAQVLLFCFNQPHLPVDDQLRRALASHDLIDGEADLLETQAWCTRQIPERAMLEAHLLLQGWLEEGAAM